MMTPREAALKDRLKKVVKKVMDHPVLNPEHPDSPENWSGRKKWKTGPEGGKFWVDDKGNKHYASSPREAAIALRVAGPQMDRHWDSRGNLVVMYWQKELWYGDIQEIKKAFAELERAAEKEYAELKDKIGSKMSRPGDARAFVHGKTGKLTAGISIAFGKEDANEDWHTVLFNWTH